MSKKLTTDEFIAKAREVHGDKYDYSKVKYVNNRTKVCIICTEHGEFWQTPSSHLKGCGCPRCVGRNKTITEFIEKARKIHGDKYDYSKVEYKNATTKVCINCPIHGEFWQTPSSHLSGNGCPKCAHDAIRMSRDEFITKAREVHGDKYDYSKVEYIDCRTKVCIICPEHGEFWQVPYYHLSGNGCPKCGGVYQPTREEFIEKAREIHGDKYDYSKVEYNGNKTKVCIICPEHGEFWQTPNCHLRVQGCTKCGYEKISKNQRKSFESFLIKAQKIHGDKYDYSNVEYIDRRTKVCIICPIHGEFLQTPSEHLNGHGCSKCAHKNIADKQRFSNNDFITKAREIHGDKYDYSNVKYVDSLTKVCIVCPKHGEFWQTPNKHLNRQGCPKCGYEKNAEILRMTREEFIEKAREVHGDKYNYSKVKYIDCRTKVCIICPEHGEFWQVPTYHLSGNGCPRCNESHLERDVNALLVENNIVFETQKTFKGLGQQKCDFYISSLNTIIECQGGQHFEYVDFFHKDKGFETEQKRDIKKHDYLINHGYKIIYYTDIEKYDTFLGEPLIKNLEELKNKLNI